MMNNKTAFVAMKFNGNHWSDKKYIAISDVLEEAGYVPIRADQIKTSKPIVDEVCGYLENSELVIIDSSGDSHSVSYEIGYCHGIMRSQEKTILIRQGDGRDIPFNYQHFRHFCYKDLRHLKRILRDFFSITIPLSNDQFGYALNIRIGKGCDYYGYSVAEAILNALENSKFNGRCEYFATDGFMFGLEKCYLVGLGLKSTKNEVPTLNWWLNFRKKVDRELKRIEPALEIDHICSELCEISALKAQYLPRGTIQFIKGVATLILNPESPENDSYFIACINERTQQVV